MNQYLEAALKRVKSESFDGALILAHHHPAYTAGSQHGWSTDMLGQIDKACNDAGVWPHAVLSAHAHNYQRFTRLHGKTQIPYIICGNGGHGLAKLRQKGISALRTREPKRRTTSSPSIWPSASSSTSPANSSRIGCGFILGVSSASFEVPPRL